MTGRDGSTNGRSGKEAAGGREKGGGGGGGRASPVGGREIWAANELPLQLD